MRRPALVLAVVALLPGAVLLPATAPPAAAQEAPAGVTVVPLSFAVPTGPDDRVCEVLGDLYLPASPAPTAAVLTTNGFGGSKDDEGPNGTATAARHYAERGYVGLSYSGLGFGGSGCEIELDQPVWDGRVGDELVQFLGGRTGLATLAGTTTPYEIGGRVLLDEDSDLPFDPVAGMIGVSYGGQAQFATASFGRLDAIVPQITWNDLADSLAPSNTGTVRTALDPLSVSAPRGVSKIGWTGLFTGLGLTQDLMRMRTTDLGEQLASGNACPNFDPAACTAVLDLALDGAPSAETLAFARGASVTSYLDAVDVPVLLSQGQADTLFDLQEAIATWGALDARGVPVKMVWQSWGHSTSTPVPGELDLRLPAEETHLGALYASWFDHHLLGIGEAPSLDTTYFRDWVAPDGGTRAEVAAAYASAPGYPVAPTSRLLLSGTDALVATPGEVEAGAARFASVVPAGLPTSYSEIPVIAQDGAPTDTPGTFAQWTTPPLERDLDLAGVPALTVQLSRTVPALPLPDGAGDLVLFAKLYDVAPDGTVLLQHKLVSAVRAGDLSAPVRIELPGVVQRVPAGHRLAVVLAASDSGYRGNTVPTDVTVTTSPEAPGVLELPVLAAAAGGPGAGGPGAGGPGAGGPGAGGPGAGGPGAGGPAAAPTAAGSSRPGATARLAATGPAAAVPLAAAVVLGAALALRRRRTA